MTTNKDRYDILYAAPPWDYAGQTQHSGRGGQSSGGAATHYPTMPLKDLKAMRIPAGTNSLLCMWTSSPHLTIPRR